MGPKNELYGVWYGGWGGGVVQSTSTVAGLAFPFEAALGGPIAENLALGGGLYGAAVPLLERNADPRAVGLIGPMIDYYWDDFDGVHTELAAGVGTTVEEKTKIDKLRGAAGLAAGIGYEWRASARWNVGGLFRVLALIEEQPTVVPGLLFTGTYL